MNTECNSDTYFLRRSSRKNEESNDDSMFASQTYLSVDQKTDCGSVSMNEDKQYWCEQWVLAHREGNVSEEKKYVAKKKCVVTNASSNGTESYESSLDLNNLKKRKEPRSRKNILDLDKITMSFKCGWDECYYESSSVKDYFKHVSNHVNNLWNEEWQSNKDRWFSCLWNNCTYQSNCEVKSTTHVNFHAYHTRLKCIGLAVLHHWEIPECKLNGDGIDILPDLPDEFMCYWNDCGECFECMQEYVYHVTQHLEKSNFKNNNLICPWTDCTDQFTMRYRLVQHLRSHTQEKTCACPTCGTMFSTYTKLKDHCRQSNKEKNNNQCSLCKKIFSCERLLKQHVRLHINYFKCNQCDASFSRAPQLITHIRYRHLDIKPFKCDLCESKFVSKLDLKTHLKKHAVGPLYKCAKDGCDFSCRSKYGIEKHITVAHLDSDELFKYYCHLCGELFPRGQILTKHLKTKHNIHKPASLKRFRYIEDDDGYYKLQMSRYECLDIQEQKKIKLINPKRVLIKNQNVVSNDKQTLSLMVDIVGEESDDEDDNFDVKIDEDI